MISDNKYKDYKFINLLGRQSQRMKHVNGRLDKIEEIDEQIMKLNKEKMKHKTQIMLWNSDLRQINQVIEQTTKLQKSNDSITIRKEKTRIRGFVRLYGKNLFFFFQIENTNRNLSSFKTCFHSDRTIEFTF